jgi:hypothetical protein
MRVNIERGRPDFAGSRTILASPHGHRHDGAFRERRTPPIQANPGAILMSG